MDPSSIILEKIENIISSNKIVLFMKGSQEQPMCGFSATVVQILNTLKANFKDINVLEDEELKETLKTYSNWPTIPQLYINKKFIGGCDIAMQMYKNGKLKEELDLI